MSLRDYALGAPPRDVPLPPTIAVVGTSMNSGKTTVVASMVRGLRAAGLNAMACKITGTGAGGDAWLMKDSGAELVLDFTDAGAVSTSLLTLPELEEIMDTLLFSSLVHVAKEGGNWLFDLTYEGYGSRVDINDLGYLTRANIHSFGGVGQYRDRTPGRFFLEQQFNLELFDRWNTDGLKLGELYQLNSSGKTTGFWEYFIELHYRAAHFDEL